MAESAGAEREALADRGHQLVRELESALAAATQRAENFERIARDRASDQARAIKRAQKAEAELARVRVVLKKAPFPSGADMDYAYWHAHNRIAALAADSEAEGDG